jgi:hypothetical protein
MQASPQSGTPSGAVFTNDASQDEAIELVPTVAYQPDGGEMLTRQELRLNPPYDPLRGGPRFEDLVAGQPGSGDTGH